MATRKGPGKFYRKGLTLLEIVRQFDTPEKGEAWFIEQRWPNGIACPHCGSLNVATIASRKPMPFRCRDCRKHFSVKTGTVLQRLQYLPRQVGDSLLPLHDEPQGRVQHEATP